MSFLAGRLAGKEGAYFFQESKHAVNRLVEKSTNTKPTTTLKNLPSSSSSAEHESQADVLPEALRHSISFKISGRQFDQSASPFTASKWVLRSDHNPDGVSTANPDALNPLLAYVSLPQVTFGPKRQEHSVRASTANEMRKDRYTPICPEKLQAASEGLAHLGKAFAVATVLVFGGATAVFGFAVSNLELHKIDDIRTKGKDLVQPKFHVIRKRL